MATSSPLNPATLSPWSIPLGLVSISELPDASAATGNEVYVFNQNGNTKKGDVTSAVATVTTAATGVNDTTGLQALLNASQPEDIITLRRNSIYRVDGLSLSGLACGIDLNGSKILARPGIAGPVIDFTGYASPSNAKWRRRALMNGVIEGDGTAGAAKKGIVLDSVSTLIFESVAILNTGGVPLSLNFTQLCDFNRITLNQPVSANANNIPYLLCRGGTTGLEFSRLGLRSITTDAEGVGGCIRLEDDGVDAPHYIAFSNPWLEYLHIPAGGSIFQIQGNHNLIDFSQWFDSSEITAAANTACVRLLATSGAPVSEAGGNEIRGLIPGTSGGDSIDRGVYIAQSRNAVIGVKGFNGGNVEYAPGVQGCFTTFTGQESGGIGTGSPAGVVDNSGNYDNGWMDHVSGEWVDGPRKIKRNSNEAVELTRRDGGAPSIDFGGASGARMFVTTANNRYFFRGGRMSFQNVGGTTLGEFNDDADVAAGSTSLLIRRNQGGVYSAQVVSEGVADSGGAGYRVLRIPN
jgi:hypothetical protein